MMTVVGDDAKDLGRFSATLRVNFPYKPEFIVYFFQILLFFVHLLKGYRAVTQNASD